MKRNLTVLMALVVVFAMILSFASCGSSEGEDEAKEYVKETAVY